MNYFSTMLTIRLSPKGALGTSKFKLSVVIRKFNRTGLCSTSTPRGKTQHRFGHALQYSYVEPACLTRKYLIRPLLLYRFTYLHATDGQSVVMTTTHLQRVWYHALMLSRRYGSFVSAVCWKCGRGLEKILLEIHFFDALI